MSTRFVLDSTRLDTDSTDLNAELDYVRDFIQHHGITKRFLRRFAAFVQLAAGTITRLGNTTAVTETGTFSHSTALVDSFKTMFNTYTSGAVSGNAAGWAHVATTIASLPKITIRIATGANISACRIWAGLFNSDPTASDTPANGIGFRYSTAVDGTLFWRIYTDGPSTETFVTTVPIAASSYYKLAIELVSATQAKFYINDVLVYTSVGGSPVLPVSTVSLTFRAQVTTLEAVAKVISISGYEGEHN